MRELLTYNLSGHPKLAPYVLYFLSKNVATKQNVNSLIAQVEKKMDDAQKATKNTQVMVDKVLAKE